MIYKYCYLVRNGHKGEYRFSSLMKQKKKGENCAVFCFAGKRFFFIFMMWLWSNFFINAPLITTHPSTVPKSLLTPLDTTHHLIHLGINSTETTTFTHTYAQTYRFTMNTSSFYLFQPNTLSSSPSAPSRLPLALPFFFLPLPRVH